MSWSVIAVVIGGASLEPDQDTAHDSGAASPRLFAIARSASGHSRQPVESLRRDLHGCTNPRHSGRLGGVGGVSGPGFTHYRPLHRRFSDADLCSANFNIRTERRETGSMT